MLRPRRRRLTGSAATSPANEPRFRACLPCGRPVPGEPCVSAGSAASVVRRRASRGSGSVSGRVSGRSARSGPPEEPR